MSTVRPVSRKLSDVQPETRSEKGAALSDRRVGNRPARIPGITTRAPFRRLFLKKNTTMNFTQFPALYAAAGLEALYVVEQETAGNIDMRVRDRKTNLLLGSRRFTETTRAEFDIAPLIRRAMDFVPTTGATGFKPEISRSLLILIEAGVSGSGNWSTTSPTRTFIPGDLPAQSAIRTSMPLERLIPEGAADELTLLSANPTSATVTAQARGSLSAESFRSTSNGLQIFRLDTRDFPGCETITVELGSHGTVVYTVVPASQNAVRIAWRSHAGSIEHYSFPTVRSTTLRVAKQRAEGIEGHLVTAAETARETTLVSAFESPEVLEALAEAISSPQVWMLKDDLYSPIDILTDEAVIQRLGTLCSLELVARPKIETTWN